MSSSSNLVAEYNPNKTKFTSYDAYRRYNKTILTQQYINKKSIKQNGGKHPSILDIQNIQFSGELINNNFTQGTNSPLN